MTPEQIAAVRALEKCTFLPGSFDKRFARDMAQKADNAPDAELTEKQADCLLVMLHRYRRQHKACRCDVCRGAKASQ